MHDFCKTRRLCFKGAKREFFDPRVFMIIIS
jgi:hypothetical protein